MVSQLDDNALYTLYRDDPQGKGREAFNTFAERHYQGLTERIARRLRILTTTAEDIAQNVFIQLMGPAAQKFDPTTGDVVGWMNWLADNRSKNEKRDRYRRPLLDTDWSASAKNGVSNADGNKGAASGMGASSPYMREIGNLFDGKALSREESPDFDAQQREIVDAFWRFATALEPNYRDTLVMVYVEGISQSRCARELGVQRTTIMRRLDSILPKLEATMGEELRELRSPLERRQSHRARLCAVA